MKSKTLYFLFLFLVVRGEMEGFLMHEDIYENYKADKYIHYRHVHTGQYDIVPTKRNGKVISVRKPIMEKKIISFEEIKALNLDNYGQDVRTCAEDFSFVHNYLFDYWGAILGTDAIAAYLHLKRYCFGKKDFCFPDMEMIQAKMKKGSRNTVIKAMEVLEEYGFITKILRKNKENNNADASPFFKIRRYIPLLSEELIQQLPEKLRIEHDKFLAEANGIILEENTNFEEVIGRLLKNSDSMKSKKQKDKENELKRQGKLFEYILTRLSSEEHENWLILLRALNQKISKPSFDTWFSNTILLLNEDKTNIKVICNNHFIKDWIQDRYKDVLIETIQETFSELQFSTVSISIECLLIDEYIKEYIDGEKYEIKSPSENIS